ncbi:MAG TPA: DUF4126 family protein [Chthoniobacterales bacterium]|nr:DUF4126 family protein [Chthoniobacterales bacterium]
METFLFAAGIGFVAGLRTFLAPAAAAWAVRLGWLNLNGSPFAFMESNLALAGLTIGALGELVADLVPSIPRRTAVAPLLARLLSGAFCGACLCASANRSLPIGALLGAVGAIIGAFAGYEIRRWLVTKLNIKDVFIALSEDLVAVGLALFFVSR